MAKLPLSQSVLWWKYLECKCLQKVYGKDAYSEKYLGPVLTHPYHLNSIVYTRVYFWCCIFHGLQLVCTYFLWPTMELKKKKRKENITFKQGGLEISKDKARNALWDEYSQNYHADCQVERFPKW